MFTAKPTRDYRGKVFAGTVEWGGGSQTYSATSKHTVEGCFSVHGSGYVLNTERRL